MITTLKSVLLPSLYNDDISLTIISIYIIRTLEIRICLPQIVWLYWLIVYSAQVHVLRALSHTQSQHPLLSGWQPRRINKYFKFGVIIVGFKETQTSFKALQLQCFPRQQQMCYRVQRRISHLWWYMFMGSGKKSLWFAVTIAKFAACVYT